MAIGTGLALGIGLAASAGTQLASAKIASGASKDAANIQSRSADKAMGVMRDVYRDQQALMGPYVQGGHTAYNSLMRQYGDAGRPMPTYGQAPQQPQPQPMPPGGRPRPVGAGQSAGAQMSTMGSVMRPQPMGPQMIRLRAPTGEVREVPAHLADRALAAGAVRVQ